MWTQLAMMAWGPPAPGPKSHLLTLPPAPCSATSSGYLKSGTKSARATEPSFCPWKRPVGKHFTCPLQISSSLSLSSCLENTRAHTHAALFSCRHWHLSLDAWFIRSPGQYSPRVEHSSQIPPGAGEPSLAIFSSPDVWGYPTQAQTALLHLSRRRRF